MKIETKLNGETLTFSCAVAKQSPNLPAYLSGDEAKTEKAKFKNIDGETRDITLVYHPTKTSNYGYYQDGDAIYAFRHDGKFLESEAKSGIQFTQTTEHVVVVNRAKKRNQVSDKVKESFTVYSSADSKLSLEEDNDCTVVALSAATNIKYDTAHKILAKLGRQPKKGFPLSHHLKTNLEIDKYKFEEIKLDKPTAICSFISQHKKGTFIIATRKHVQALRNGKLFDRGFHPRAIVLGAYKLVK